MSKLDMVHVVVACALFVLWWCFVIDYYILLCIHVQLDVDGDMNCVELNSHF